MIPTPPTPDSEAVSRRCGNCMKCYHGALVCPACGDPAGTPYIEAAALMPPGQRFAAQLEWGRRASPLLGGSIRVTLRLPYTPEPA